MDDKEKQKLLDEADRMFPQGPYSPAYSVEALRYALSRAYELGRTERGRTFS